MARRRSCKMHLYITIAALVMLQLLAVALHPDTGPWLLTLLGLGMERRLQRYANVGPSQSAQIGTGCVDVSLAAASVTFDLSTKACNGFACPPCFRILNASNAVNTLTLAKCSEMMMGNSAHMGHDIFANGVQLTTIINNDATKEAVVIDGTGIQTRMHKNSAAIAVCSAGSGNRLQFVSPSAATMLRTIVAEKDTNTCPDGSSRITNEAKCREAAAYDFRTFGGLVTDPAKQPIRPGGCYLIEDIITVIFNPHPTGAANAGEAPICSIDAASYAS